MLMTRGVSEVKEGGQNLCGLALNVAWGMLMTRRVSEVKKEGQNVYRLPQSEAGPSK